MKVLIDQPHGNYLPDAEYAARKRKLLEGKVTKDPESGCWLHPGPQDDKGYCRDNWRSKHEMAHRVSYRAFKGPIPEGKQVRHKECGRGCCINPEHLELGTQLDNEADKRLHGTDGYNRGSGRYNAKINEAQAAEIRVRAKTESHAKLAKEFGIARPSVGRIMREEIWKTAP